MAENLDLSSKVDSRQKELVEALTALQKDQLYLERMGAREAELKRANSRVEETIIEVEASLGEEQANYNSIMQHMRSSIEEDEKAISLLTQQAQSLTTIVK